MKIQFKVWQSTVMRNFRKTCRLNGKRRIDIQIIGHWLISSKVIILENVKKTRMLETHIDRRITLIKGSKMLFFVLICVSQFYVSYTQPKGSFRLVRILYQMRLDLFLLYLRTHDLLFQFKSQWIDLLT